jgi:hypothetical protein
MQTSYKGNSFIITPIDNNDISNFYCSKVKTLVTSKSYREILDTNNYNLIKSDNYDLVTRKNAGVNSIFPVIFLLYKLC